MGSNFRKACGETGSMRLMGLMKLCGGRWGPIRALIQTNAFEDDDEDENENEASLAAIGLKIEQRRLRARFVAFGFASCRFGLG
jgi:hypothetical protein